jgi:hypothetical protein
MLVVMNSILLFPNYPELRLYRLEPEQVKAYFLAHSHLPRLVRTLSWTLRRHVLDWKLQVDVTKVVVGEPETQPSVEPLSVEEVLLQWAEVRQQRAEEAKHLSEEDIDQRTRISLNSLWTAHQEHYTLTLRSTSGHHLMTVGTPAYSNGGVGFLFYK